MARRASVTMRRLLEERRILKAELGREAVEKEREGAEYDLEKAERSRKYLREAEELLERKDYPQASEKLWGATAERIKAVAAKW